MRWELFLLKPWKNRPAIGSWPLKTQITLVKTVKTQKNTVFEYPKSLKTSIKTAGNLGHFPPSTNHSSKKASYTQVMSRSCATTVGEESPVCRRPRSGRLIGRWTSESQESGVVAAISGDCFQYYTCYRRTFF